MTVGTGPGTPPADGWVRGSVSNISGGQVAVGGRVFQIDAQQGAQVVINADVEVRVVRRPVPVMRADPPFHGLVGRAAELGRISATLAAGTSVEVFGPNGIGKTALVRTASNAPLTARTPDGVVAVPAQIGVPDILAYLFDACYVGTHRLVPRREELASSLHDLRLLLVIDDPSLDRDDLGAIRQALPWSLLLLAGPEQRLFGDADGLALGGLPVDAGLALVESQVGRTLTPNERDVAAGVCQVLRGTPLELVRFCALVRMDAGDLVTVARGFGVGARPEDLLVAVQRSTSQAEAAVLAALAAFDAPVGAGPVAAYTGQPHAGEILAALARRGLVQGDDLQGWQPRERVPARPDDRHRAALALTGWARERSVPEEVAAEIPAVNAVLRAARDDRRYTDVIALAAAVESALALAGRWVAWQSTLRMGLDAATSAGDRASAAFFAHQLAVIDDAMSGAPVPLTQTLADSVTRPATSTRAVTTAGPPAGPVAAAGGTARPWWRRPPFVASILLLVLAMAILGAVLLLRSAETSSVPGPPEPVTTPTAPETEPSESVTTSEPPIPPSLPNLQAAVQPDSGTVSMGEEQPIRVEVSNPDLAGQTVAVVEGGLLTLRTDGPATLQVDGSGCEQQSDTQVTCQFGQLDPDGRAVFDIVLSVTEPGTVTLTAEVSDDQEQAGSGGTATFRVVCIVPDVVGQPVGDAEKAVAQAGLIPQRVPTEAGNLGDEVVRTDPEVGQDVECRTTVQIFYSTLS